MPETFPVLDPHTGDFVDTKHYSVAEVAAMVHLHPSTVYRLAHREHWPHLSIAGRMWFAQPDVVHALATMRRNDGPHVPEADGAPALGLALPPDEAAPTAESDAGGIR